MRLEDKVAIVTGSGRGLGKAMLERLAAEGAHVVVSDIDADNMNAVAAELRDAGYGAIAVKADVTLAEDMQALVEKTVDAFGRVDILVNNAGAVRQRPFREMSDSDWDFVLDVNLKGVFFGIQAVAPQMITQRYGKIVNIGSSGGTGAGGHHSERMSWSGNVNYQCAKAGVIQLTRTFARELGPHNITVNCISNGCLATQMGTNIRAPEEVRVHVDEVAKLNVLGRAGLPHETANVVLFLASDESSFISGQNLNVDGGITDRM